MAEAESAPGGSGPDERDATDQSASDRNASDRNASDRGASDRSASDRSGADRSGADRGGVWGAATDPAGARPASERPIRELPIREVSRPQSRPARPRKPDASGPDLLNDLQRWLLRSSAKSMRREIEGQVRRTLGSGRREPEDVWGTATTEPPSDAAEAPECAWCPICRAARRMRDNGPGLTSQITGVSDAVAAAVQDAIGAFDGVLSRTAAAPANERPADRSPRPGPADSAQGAAERAADEPGDRS
jgi:hypothetical protein